MQETRVYQNEGDIFFLAGVSNLEPKAMLRTLFPCPTFIDASEEGEG